MVLPSHGANPRRLYESLGLQVPEKIYDFSENVNPVGPPNAIQENWHHYFNLVTAYPDPLGEPFLSAVATFHSVSRDSIVLGNGASEIFTVLARRYSGKRVIVIHPTFSEYEQTLTAAGAEIVEVIVEEIASWQIPMEQVKNEMRKAAAIYICTPNNPTGVLPKRAELQELVAHGRTVGCDVILDEAFIDWVDEQLSFIPEIVNGNDHLLVVRSMTKLYAIPGIRLGYLIANEKICQQLRSQMPHWHINGLAAVIGAECLMSEQYAQEAIQTSNRSREKISAFLRDFHCEVSQSVTNYIAFRLRDTSESAAFFRFCLERGVVLRHSLNFKGMNGQWFRIGMKNKEVMAILEYVLAQWFKKEK